MLRVFSFFMLLSCLSADAQDNIRDYLNSFQRMTGLQTHKWRQVAEHISIGAPSTLDGWMGNNAYYRNTANWLIVPRNLLDTDLGRVKPANVLALQMNASRFRTRNGTLWHELAHAMYDVHLEEDNSIYDTRLYNVMKNDVKPWMDTHFGAANDDIAMQEFHAYYVGEFVKFYLRTMIKAAKDNGLEWNGQITANDWVRQQATEMDLESFKRFIPKGRDFQIKDKIKQFAIVASGETLDYYTRRDKGFREEWYEAVWTHVNFYFTPADTHYELVERMSNHYPHRVALANFRERLCNEVNAQTETEEDTSDDAVEPTFDGIGAE
jgi:hypothetical protein